MMVMMTMMITYVLVVDMVQVMMMMMMTTMITYVLAVDLAQVWKVDSGVDLQVEVEALLAEGAGWYRHHHQPYNHHDHWGWHHDLNQGWQHHHFHDHDQG